MAPAAITIGVPVFDEEKNLAGALEALRTQPFQGIEVQIYDNASTDATPRIAAEFVARDPRFHYFRQPANKGMLQNFYDVLQAAKSPYFMWRAPDDRADVDLIERLYRALDSSPHKDLAVSRIVSRDLDGRFPRVYACPAVGEKASFANRRRLLFESHPSWIYCLFRREPLLQRMHTVVSRHGHEWAADHLTLFPFLFDNRVVCVPETTFHQVMKRVRPPGARRHPRAHLELALMEALRKRFRAVLADDLAARVRSPLARWAYSWLLWLYVGKRVYRFRMLVRRRLMRDLLRRAEAIEATPG